MTFLATRHLSIDPVRASDFPDIYSMATSGDNWTRWIMRGGSTNYTDFCARLSGPMIGSQALARTRSSGVPVAHLICYESGRHHAKFGMVVAPGFQRTGLGFEAAGCFIDFLFLNFGYRKLYVEMIDIEWQRTSRLQDVFKVEGVLTEHEFFAGKYRDLVIASCTMVEYHSFTKNLRPLWAGALVKAGLLVQEQKNYRDFPPVYIK